MGAGVQHAGFWAETREQVWRRPEQGPWFPDWGIELQPPRPVGPMYDADEWCELCELVRRRARQPRRDKVHVAEMIVEYEEATGTCVCCD